MSNAQPLASRTDLIRRIDRPVVLVGLMGVGKSTIGRRLATALRRDFVDADEAIERAANRTIAEIFAAHGEGYFRDGERRVIARLIAERRGVIATGGGAFVDPETRALILQQGIAIWLDSDLATLVERTSRNDNRPLLRNGDPEDILRNLQQTRAPFYGEAQIHVKTDNGPHDATVHRILEELDAWL